jgi:hypothetical protein
MIHHEIVRRGRRCGKIGKDAFAVSARDEGNDIRTHDRASHSAIATRPASASDIRYAVIEFSRYR